MLLNCVDEQEEKRLIEEFHAVECGGHHYWKVPVKKNNEGRVLLAHHLLRYSQEI